MAWEKLQQKKIMVEWKDPDPKPNPKHSQARALDIWLKRNNYTGETIGAFSHEFNGQPGFDPGPEFTQDEKGRIDQIIGKAYARQHKYADHYQSLSKALNTVGKRYTKSVKEIGADFGSSDRFSVGEFNNKRPIKELCQAINSDVYEITFKAPDNTIKRLNELLKTPNFYGIWLKEKKNVPLTQEIQSLIDSTKTYRNKQFSELSDTEQKKIKRLNRLLLEATYPQTCPKSHKDYQPGDGSDFEKKASYSKVLAHLEKKDKKRPGPSAFSTSMNIGIPGAITLTERLENLAETY